MSHVTIEYCHPCGYLHRAEDVQHVLLESLGDQIESVTLQPGDNGVFTVTVDDDRIFDITDDDYDVNEITRSVRRTI